MIGSDESDDTCEPVDKDFLLKLKVSGLSGNWNTSTVQYVNGGVMVWSTELDRTPTISNMNGKGRLRTCFQERFRDLISRQDKTSAPSSSQDKSPAYTSFMAGAPDSVLNHLRPFRYSLFMEDPDLTSTGINPSVPSMRMSTPPGQPGGSTPALGKYRA